ncbi:MAG TPA: SDR family oxidoreductase [bacterium]|nr:SDR family oxidoreductase [bacterium]
MITGSASFLGAAISRRFAESGYDLGLHYRRSKGKTQKLSVEMEGLGIRTMILAADLEVENDVRTLVPKILKRFGRLDVLVNNASLFLPDPPLHRYQEKKSLFSTNVFAPFLLVDQAKPHLKKTKGSVVNLTDIYGEKPILKGYETYSATKAALINLTRSLARELGPEIRVNAVSPGAFFIPKTYSKEKTKSLLDKSALKRSGEPRELAEAVYFMASHPFITGQVLNVDGGRFLI